MFDGNPFSHLIPKSGQSGTNIRYVPGPPEDPEEERKRQLDEQSRVLGNTRTGQEIQNAPLNAEQTRASIQSSQQSVINAQQQHSNAAVDQERQLSTEFQKRPEVQAFTTIAQQYGSALRAAKVDNKAADNDLINAYAKILDPASVVREGEVATAGNVGGVSEQVKGYINALNGQGRLTPEQRKEIVGQIRNRASSAADVYRQSRQHYGSIASQYGYDPDRVLGPNPAQPFQQVEADYFKHPIKNGSGFVYPHGAAPLDPNGEGDIGFVQSAQGLPPHAQDAQRDIQEMVASGKLTTPQAIVSYSKSKWGLDADPKTASAAIQSIAKGGGFTVGTPSYQPDIKNARGTKEADQKLAMQQQLMSGMPMGGIIQGAGQLFGPQKVDAFTRGVADIPTFGMSEELGAGLQTLAGGGTMSQNLAGQNAIRDYDKQNNFKTRLGGQVLGGFGLPLGAAESIPGMMRQGATVGGLYGAGSTDGGPAERLLGGVEGAVAGGATAGVLGGAGSLARRGLFAAGRRIAGTPNANQQALVRAGQEEQVPLNMSDLYPGARNTVATLETIPGAAGTVQRGIGAGRDAIEARTQALARGGTARENMGQVIQDAGDRFIARSGAQANKLYDRARNLAADTPVTPQSTVQALAGLVRQEAATPGGTRAGAVIQRYADAFEGGGAISIDGARRMRSELLSRLRDDGGLTKQQATRVTGQIMEGVNADIERSLTAAGRGSAVQAYRAADRFYAQRMTEIDDVTERFLGTEANRKSPEQSLSIIQGMLSPKGDSARAAQMLRRLSPEERKDFAATLVEPLGRRSAEEPFSPAQFIGNVRKLSPAARRLVFGNDGERSIQNLVRLSNAKKDTVQSLNNSRSGQVSNYRNVVSTLLFGVPGGGVAAQMGLGLDFGTGAAGSAAIAGAGLAASRGLAKLLMNPEFTAALGSAPASTSARAANAHVGRLREIASRNPELQEPFRALEDRLLKAVNDNFTHSAAASEADEKKRRYR